MTGSRFPTIVLMGWWSVADIFSGPELAAESVQILSS